MSAIESTHQSVSTSHALAVAGEGDVCVEGDGLDVTNVPHDGGGRVHDGVDDPPPKTIATKDTGGSCELSDDELTARSERQCHDGVDEAKQRCYEAHTSAGRPIAWGGVCDDAAAIEHAACDSGDAPQNEGELSTDSEKTTAIGCGLEAEEAQERYEDNRSAADRAVCSRREARGRETNGVIMTTEECMEVRRHGVRPGTVSDRSTRLDSHKDTREVSDGGSRKTHVDGGWKAPIGFNGGVSNDEERNWNETNGQERGLALGTDHQVTQDIDRRAGWQGRADSLYDQTYEECRQREGLEH